MERIALFNKLKSDNEFNQILNDYCDDFTINTVEIINSKLGLKREYDEKRKDYIYTRKINNVEKEQEIVKKLLKPNKKY